MDHNSSSFPFLGSNAIKTSECFKILHVGVFMDALTSNQLHFLMTQHVTWCYGATKSIILDA